MRKYEKGQLVKLISDEKKNRPVTFGVVIKVTNTDISVKFFDMMKLTLKIPMDSTIISAASIKEAERFIVLRRSEMEIKIEKARKEYKKDLKDIENFYINLQPFINKI